MVIMALLPKAIDLPATSEHPPSTGELTITTPETLPEAIAGRPYVLALAATGAQGPLHWSVSGALPLGLSVDPDSGRISGTPEKGTPQPVELMLRASDGSHEALQMTRLIVYQSNTPLTTPAWWKPAIPPVPWRAWLEQGFGFLVLWLVHIVGMNTIAGMERWSLRAVDSDSTNDESDRSERERRFAKYRATVRLTSLAAAATLAIWLWQHHA